MLPLAVLLVGQAPPEPRAGPLPTGLSLILRSPVPRPRAGDRLDLIVRNGGRKMEYGNNAGSECEVRLFARRAEGGTTYARANWAEGLPCRVVSANALVAVKPGKGVLVDSMSAGSKLRLPPGRYRVWAISVHMGRRLVSNALTVEFP